MTDRAPNTAAHSSAPLRVACFSVVPSPYQRDLFAALAARPEVQLDVFYLESASPDSPWPSKPLAAHERILPGFWFGIRSVRCHLNWALPELATYDVVILNTLMSLTAQRLMRFDLRRTPWLFWGERLGKRAGWHDALCAPLQRAAGIVSIGSVAEQDYRQRFPRTRHFNIPYHCDLSPFLAAPRHRRDGQEVTFLLCGQMIARKGLDVILQAFCGLDSRARLLLVGREAELPEMLAPIPQAIRERIRYAGFQAPEALPQYFAQADVFVLPSRYDGWGVVVNQALGAGLPLLCSDAVSAAHDLLEPEVNGLRFAAGDADSARSAMQRMLDEPQLIDEWGEQSRKSAPAWQPVAGAEKWVQTLSVIARDSA